MFCVLGDDGELEVGRFLSYRFVVKVLFFIHNHYMNLTFIIFQLIHNPISNMKNQRRVGIPPGQSSQVLPEITIRIYVILCFN